MDTVTNRPATPEVNVPRRVLGALLSSVSAGVVPRAGAPYIAIGRQDEIAALLSDLEQIDAGGGAMRFLIGRYGSGKSFLIQLIRGYALERDFITADADLSPERRLYGSGGSGVATYRELMKNLASKASPDGGALPKLIARWIGQMQDELIREGVSAEDARFDELLGRLFDRLGLSLSLQQYALVGSTVKSHLSYLTDLGKVAPVCENNRLLWQRL
jgi:hypothetical protein